MSILFGEDAREIQIPKTSSYGQRLPCVAQLPIDGACDIALDDVGHYACVAARNSLVILDLNDPANPSIISRLDIGGSGRQIERHGSIACMTARADGLFIFDVGNPKRPRLLCHYDTVELATGVCISDALCFVACRHMGVEIINISDPENPKHLSNILAGEAQSVFVSGSYLYVGAWVEREVMIFDISDPVNPQKCGACLLDGYGDGVFVWQNLCFAATGHHARNLRNRFKYQDYDFVVPEMFTDGYGCGHGLEIYDVNDPNQPLLVSRLKAPPQFLGSHDLWDVSFSDGYAYWADTYSGLFIVNTKNYKNPVFEGYYRFPPVANEVYHSQPSIQQPCGPLNGLAVGHGHVFLVSVNFGLHVIEFESAKPVAPIDPPTYMYICDTWQKHKNKESIKQTQQAQMVFRSNGQIHGVAVNENNIFVSAGQDSLYVLDADRFNMRYHSHSRGFCMDVALYQNRLFVAEGDAGFSVWELRPDGLACTARADTPQTARQVVIYEEFAIAAVMLGSSNIQFWDLKDIDQPRPLANIPAKGNMYYKNIMKGLYKNRYAVATPLKPGILFFDLASRNNINLAHVDNNILCPIEDGAGLYGDRLVTVISGKLYCEGHEIPLSTEGPELKGWPTVIDDKLFLINRHNGLITIFNITDLNNPVFIRQIETNGHPESIVMQGDTLLIPCGHRGLLRIASDFS